MNIPPADGVRVMPEELRRFAREVLEKVGVPEEHAVLLANTLVETDQRGVLSHGTQQLLRYTRQFRAGELNPDPQVRVSQEAPATAVVDGDGGLGHFAAYRAVEVALAKAKEMGTAAVVAVNHGHIGAAGTYTRRVLPEGCAALCVSGVDTRSHRPIGPPRHILQVGAGGPISFAIPASAEPPLVLDMGCYFSHRPARTRDREARLQAMREHLDEVFDVAPDAVFKIMGLGAVTMALGGILAGVSLPENPDDDRLYPGANQGTFLAVFDVARFMPLDTFLAEMDQFVRKTRSLEPLPGCAEAELPGGPEWRRERDWATEGIPIGGRHREMLEEVAQECGVELPLP
ncbi:MAG TPA: Ldh family oxidoreductase [Armatimonadota bacterium]|nr:Ldh family oxidoreductase [Armatimonadota bacterium]HOJ22594.1 Ldh family oxidoreductase [Armatimonadota bacterium]HOM81419.1 Ldh family oxidoreductase [Armatimonadota bacterium]HOQ27899.1 Ldh family oxidoreductase [Armatimonadota bacterium]HPO73142.1 Ldh family oxidoreductase [Armatimonadota bacterium]